MEHVNNTSTEEIITSTKEDEKLLSSAILATLDIKANFELYAYRIISPEDFIARLNQTIGMYEQSKNL